MNFTETTHQMQKCKNMYIFHNEFQPILLLSAVFVYFSSLCVSGRRESLNKNVLHKKMFSRSLPLVSSSENLIGYRSSLGAYNQLCCFSFLFLAQCIYFFIHIYIDYVMIKHFGEGINYPINSPVLGFSERGRREFPPERVSGSAVNPLSN